MSSLTTFTPSPFVPFCLHTLNSRPTPPLPLSSSSVTSVKESQSFWQTVNAEQSMSQQRQITPPATGRAITSHRSNFGAGRCWKQLLVSLSGGQPPDCGGDLTVGADSRSAALDGHCCARRMPASKQQQELALIKELQHILDSCNLELRPADEVWPNLYIGNVWVSRHHRQQSRRIVCRDPREGVNNVFYSLAVVILILHLYFFLFRVVFPPPGLWRRTERRYITWASLTSWTQHTPSRAALENRAFMETLVCTWEFRLRTRTVLTSASTSNWPPTLCTKPWRTKTVKRISLKCVDSIIIISV